MSQLCSAEYDHLFIFSLSEKEGKTSMNWFVLVLFEQPWGSHFTTRRPHNLSFICKWQWSLLLSSQTKVLMIGTDSMKASITTSESSSCVMCHSDIKTFMCERTVKIESVQMHSRVISMVLVLCKSYINELVFITYQTWK